MLYTSSIFIGFIFALIFYIAPILLTWGLTVKCDGVDAVCSKNKSNATIVGGVALAISILFVILGMISIIKGFKIFQIDKYLKSIAVC